MYSVAHKVQPNLNITYPQNANRHVRVRVFKTLEEAKNFASHVEVIAMYDTNGKRIKC